MNIFEQATRLKLRFNTESKRGELNVEQLWELPLTSENDVSLDGLAVKLASKIQNQSVVSFVNATKHNKDFELDKLRFDIVKHIIDVRIAEREQRKVNNERLAEIETLKQALDARKALELQNLSAEEIQKRIDELQK